MFIELFSKDVAIHGDGEDTEASFDVTGWPFNLDLSRAAKSQVSAYIVEGGGDAFIGVFTVSLQDNRILIAGHGLVDEEQVRFVLDDPMSCALPTPLVETDYYFVTGARGNDFQVSATPGGPVINMENRGMGSNEVWKRVGETREVETLIPLECENVGSQITIRFAEPIPGGETKTVRLRAKVFV